MIFLPVGFLTDIRAPRGSSLRCGNPGRDHSGQVIPADSATQGAGKRYRQSPFHSTKILCTSESDMPYPATP